MGFKRLFGIFVAFFLVFMSVREVSASEGQVELRNTAGGQSRCLAVSGLLPDNTYNILVICRELLYPANPEAPRYVLWASPVTGNNNFRLGDLGFGKSLFKTKTAFSSLFVTEERDTNVKSPQGTMVLRGSVESIEFLGQPSPSTPDNGGSLPSVSPTPTPAGQSRSLLSRFGGGTILTIIAVFVIILMLVLVKPFK